MLRAERVGLLVCAVWVLGHLTACDGPRTGSPGLEPPGDTAPKGADAGTLPTSGFGNQGTGGGADQGSTTPVSGAAGGSGAVGTGGSPTVNGGSTTPNLADAAAASGEDAGVLGR